MKNFIYTLVDYIKQLELDYPVRIGIFDDEASLVVRPIVGSEIINEYINGMIDIRLPFEIIIKSKNQEESFNVIRDVMNHVRKLDDFLKKENKAPLLLGMVIDQIPTTPSNDEAGYFYYTSKLTVDLTVT
jgi:hypothetical protein